MKKGSKMSDEQRARIAASMKGKRLGAKLSDEAKQRIADRMKGNANALGHRVTKIQLRNLKNQNRKEGGS